MQVPPGKTPLAAWWIIWFAIVGGLVVVRLVADSQGLATTADHGPLAYAGVGPLALSALLRWLVLPRVEDRGKALVLFVLGMALAEGCGFLGYFLGGDKRDALFLLGVLGVAQWIPFFASRFYRNAGTDRHGLRQS